MDRKNNPILKKILDEQNQGHKTRIELYTRLEDYLGVPILSYYTSFQNPSGIINDLDADMIEGLLQKMNTPDGFCLMVNSPGGSGLAAERIINICRAYSGENGYKALVPSKAKSAGTMVCLGASEIIMSDSSELGPIDPQMLIFSDDEEKMFSAYNMVLSYKTIFDNALTCDGNLEPYLQALNNYDPRIIEECRSQIELSADIAVKTLKSGMLKGKNDKDIRNKMKIFLVPKETKVHGRPIYYQEAKSKGLLINYNSPKSDLWSTVHELHLRLNQFVNVHNYAKCLENKEDSFVAGGDSK